jgi:uncharacterized membrane protein YedE/YeeE
VKESAKTIVTSHAKQGRPYWNPYLAGLGLGLTLLLSFAIVGRGLGASGGFTALVSAGVGLLAPEHAVSNGLFSAYIHNDQASPLLDWLVFLLGGVLIGGFVSGRLAGRMNRTVEKGPRVSLARRLMFAFVGGTFMGFAAKLARGCTSGQALTGGSLLSLGSWVFMLSVFAGGYAFAYFLRRQWT